MKELGATRLRACRRWFRGKPYAGTPSLGISTVALTALVVAIAASFFSPSYAHGEAPHGVHTTLELLTEWFENRTIKFETAANVANKNVQQLTSGILKAQTDAKVNPKLIPNLNELKILRIAEDSIFAEVAKKFKIAALEFEASKLAGKAVHGYEITHRAQALAEMLTGQIQAEERILIDAGIPLAGAVGVAGACMMRGPVWCFSSEALDFTYSKYKDVDYAGRLLSEPLQQQIKNILTDFESIERMGKDDARGLGSGQDVDAFIAKMVAGHKRFFDTTRDSISEVFGTKERKEGSLNPVTIWLRENIPIMTWKEQDLLKELDIAERVLLGGSKTGSGDESGTYDGLAERLKSKLYMGAYAGEGLGVGVEGARDVSSARHEEMRLLAEMLAGISIEGSGLAVALVVDVSGSMKEDGKLPSAVAAAKANIVSMVADTVMSVSSFSDSARLVIANAPAGQAESGAFAALNGLTPSGGTNIESGLDMGYGQLIASGAPNCTIVLLSDGKNNIGDPQRAVARFQQRTTGCTGAIEAVGLGEDADAVALKSLANSTGGSFWPASSRNLASVYQKIGAKTRNESTTLDSTDMLGAGETVELDLVVGADTTTLGGFWSWEGSRLEAEFIDPSGARFSEAEIRAAGGRYEVSETTALLKLPNPTPGKWKVRLRWSEPPVAKEAVSLVITDGSPIVASFLSFDPEYAVGAPVRVRVQAAEVVRGGKGREPLRNATVSVEIQKPVAEPPKPSKPENLLLRKKRPEPPPKVPRVTRAVSVTREAPPEGAPTYDATFSGEFAETDAPGPYIATATIRGTLSDGTQIEKVIASSFQVGPLADNKVRTADMHNLNLLLRPRASSPLDARPRSGSSLLERN